MVSFSAVLVVLEFFTLVGLPIALTWGWLRWWKRAKTRDLFSNMSLTGFALATASAVLGALMWVYAKAIGGFSYYDPALLRIYRYGALISLCGIGFAIVGLWRRNVLRWHAPVCAAGTLLYWIMLGSTE
jgi:hypothetical protein